MRIVELGDYSMVIMKDSEDPRYISVGNYYRFATNNDRNIIVDLGDQITFNYLRASEFVYSAGRLVLFFKEKIPPKFHLHDRVAVSVEI